MHAVRCTHGSQCFNPGQSVSRGGAAGDTARVQDMATDSQLAHEFLQVVANVDGVCEQFGAVPSAVQVCMISQMPNVMGCTGDSGAKGAVVGDTD